MSTMPTNVGAAREVPVEMIDRDYRCFPREKISTARVEEFADLYEDGGLEALPPVTVVQALDGRLIRADGEHRLCALELLEHAICLVEIITSNGADALQLAYEVALTKASAAAQPLSWAERQTAAARLLAERPDLADRQIARLVGVSHQTVGRLRHSGPEDQPAAAPRGPSPEQAARKLLRAFERLRQARGLGFADWLGGGDRTGQRFASALWDVFAEDAVEQARLFSDWLSEAAELLDSEQEED